MNDIISWLFERRPADTWPQIGCAGADKRALVWIPGRKPVSSRLFKWATDHAVLSGCSQLAVKNLSNPIDDQMPVWICWIGLDVDDDPGLGALQAALDDPTICTFRRSSGGGGWHLLYRLDEPIPATYRQSAAIIKNLTAPFVDELNDWNIEVCSSDRRMFWLKGGKCHTVLESSKLFTPPGWLNIHEPLFSKQTDGVEPEPVLDGSLNPEIGEWAARLGVKPGTNKVYLGHVVPILRELGETVNTRSPMTGNGKTNAIMDVTPTQITLWSFTDSKYIWKFCALSAYGL